MKLLRELAAQRPLDVSVRLNLLQVPDVYTATAEAQKYVDEIKTIEGDRGVRWPLEQVKLWLRAATTLDPDARRRELVGREKAIVSMLSQCSEAQRAGRSRRLCWGWRTS